MPRDRELIGQARDLVDDDTPACGIRRREGEVLGMQSVQGVGMLPQRGREALEHPALLLVERLAALDRHHHGSDDALEDRHLGLDDPRHHHVCAVAGQGGQAIRLASRRGRCAREAADQVGREVLQAGVIRARPVERGNPFREAHEPVQGIGELVAGEVEPNPRLDRGEQRFVLGGIRQPRRIEVAVDDRVLEVVDGVGDVVGEVHDLRLDAADAPWRTGAQPAEHRLVVGIHAELEPPAGIGQRVLEGPGVLARGVEARPREVQAETLTLSRRPPSARGG